MAANRPGITVARPSWGAARAMSTTRMRVSIPFGVLKNLRALGHIAKALGSVLLQGRGYEETFDIETVEEVEAGGGSENEGGGGESVGEHGGISDHGGAGQLVGAAGRLRIQDVAGALVIARG